MKSFLSAVIILLLLSESAGAQDNKTMAWRTRYGALAGVTGSTLSGESDSYTGLLIGPQLGFFLSLDPGMPDYVIWQIEANVTMQGSEYSEPGLSGKVATTYINLPIVWQMKSKKGIYGEVGVQPAFLVSAKDKYNGATYDYKDYVNTFDFAIPVGVGYHVARTAAINFRYIHGLSNVNKNDTEKDHNRVFALRFLWFFGAEK